MSKKEDEERPTCRRCINAGYECEGYPSGLRIVFDKSSSQPGDEEDTTLEAPGSRSSGSSGSGELSPAGDYQGILVRQQSLQGLSLPAQLDFSSLHGNIYHSYLVENFLKHIQIGRGCFLPAWENRSLTTADSVGALAAAFYGRVQHQQRVSQEGAVLYGQALAKLAQDLNNNDTVWSVSTLLSVIALAIYETTQFKFQSIFLIMDRSLLPPKSTDGFTMPEAARAIANSKRTFLEEREWRTIPWAADPSQKSRLDHLIDIFCVIPGLLEKQKALGFSPWQSGSAISAFTKRHGTQINKRFDEVEAQLHVLQVWKQSWNAANPSAAQSSPPSSYLLTSRDDLPYELFGSPLNFPDALRANEYTVYNTNLFLLLGLAHHYQLADPSRKLSTDFLKSLLPLSPENPHPNARASMVIKTRRQAAINVCRAVPYHLLFEVNGFSGAYLLMFPLNVVLRQFQPGSGEANWIRRVLDRIRDKWGFESGSRWLDRED
ncbi:MAG: hypothetical protein Q9191_006427 [Dirinaria sp. TL-2023a]